MTHHPLENLSGSKRIPRAIVERIETLFLRNFFKEDSAIVDVLPMPFRMAPVNTVLLTYTIVRYGQDY